MAKFIEISDVNFTAFANNTRSSDIVSKKKEIFDCLEEFYNLAPTTILFIGFSSFIFASSASEIFVTDVSDEIQDYLRLRKIKFTYVPRENLVDYVKKIQVVVVADEYFTYAETDQSQKISVTEICSLATEYVITTLRDYKNQDYKDREFSIPTISKNLDNLIFLESHEYTQNDRNAWTSSIYQINSTTSELTTYGKFDRRAMYFKQLAKFSSDAGSTNFFVHKNLMYKSLFRKNYEHVITIKFD